MFTWRISRIAAVLMSIVLLIGANILPARACAAVPVSSPSTDRAQLFARMSVEELASYLKDPKDPDFSEAYGVLRTRGAAAIPAMIELMKRDDFGSDGMSGPDRFMAEIGDAGRPALLELLKGDNRIGRANAAFAFAVANQPCKEAISPLIDLLKDDVTADFAARALALNGSDAAGAVPSLIPLAFKSARGVPYGSSSPYQAVKAIGLDPRLIPTVVEHIRIHDPKGLEEWRQIVGVNLLSAAGKNGTPALAKLLTDPDLSVRLASAKAIQMIGKTARIEAVEKALNSAVADDRTRVDAALALVAIGASAKNAVPGLVKDLESCGNPSPHVWRSFAGAYLNSCAAARTLSLIPEAVPYLIAGLDSDKSRVRVGSILSIPNDPVVARQTVPKLWEFIAHSTSDFEQWLAVEKLYQLDPVGVQNAVGAGVKLPPQQGWWKVTPSVVAAAKERAAKR